MAYSNGTFTYKKDDDNVMFPSTQICLQKTNIVINDTLDFNAIQVQEKRMFSLSNIR